MNNKKITYSILALYPAINIIACYIFHGDNMNTLSLLFCFLILAINCKIGTKISKQELCFILISFGAVVLSFVREDRFSDKIISVLYFTTILLFIFCYENRIDVGYLNDQIKKNVLEFYVGQVIFLFVLLLHVFQNGLTYGWNTVVLQGPYNYPHTLAYILLFMLCGNLAIILNNIRFIPILLSAVETVMIVLTAVRSVCVALAIVALFVLYYYLKSKKYFFLMVIVLMGLSAMIFAYYKGVFDSFVAKTTLSVQGGYGLTNNRGNTVLSSINTFRNYGIIPLNLIFGCGLESIYKQNYVVLGEAIHAHNDFIDVLVSYGVLNFIIYVKCFYKMSKINTRSLWMFLMMFVLAFFNGVFSYIDCLPIIVWGIILFNYAFDGKRNAC